ncbi:MAG TPA: alpha/beta hydrolase [Frankiaceae bacterium]|nr:alpha/beta hydrolase [Frankiaceae bacterium]
MKLPLRMRLFGLAYGRWGTPISRTPAEGVPALRARQNRSYGLRAARIVMGRHAEGVEVEDVVAVNADGGPLPVRIYRPPTSVRRPLPAVLNFHGGGFATGSLDQAEWLCREVCYRAGVTVVSVDYRMAPEHPFPTPPDDCYAALTWVATQAERLGIDAGRLAVMGDSAGGNLSAVVCLMARDRGGPRLRSQVLIYPGTDFVTTYPSEIRNATAPVLRAEDIAAYSAFYRAGTDGTHPYASPLRAPDHRGLPPALVQTAEHDALLDEGHLYARALARAGVPVRYTEYVGTAHGFISMPGLAPQAHQALWEIVTELRARLVDPQG